MTSIPPTTTFPLPADVAAEMVETATGEAEAEAEEISGFPRTITIWIRNGDAPAHGTH